MPDRHHRPLQVHHLLQERQPQAQARPEPQPEAPAEQGDQLEALERRDQLEAHRQEEEPEPQRQGPPRLNLPKGQARQPGHPQPRGQGQSEL